MEFALGVHTDGERQFALKFNTLFKVEAKPEFGEALKFIHNSRKHLWPVFHPDPTFKQSEKNLMLSDCISSEILVPLCKEVILEKRYASDPVIAGIQCSDIGIGTLNTWHGTPDLQVRGEVYFMCEKIEEGENTRAITTVVESDDASVSSDGMTTTIKGNIAFNLPQAVATCVISSFTENALHPDKPALVPTILIDEKNFQVCLYECTKDVLLISNPKLLSTKGGLSQSGMALLWAVVNHR